MSRSDHCFDFFTEGQEEIRVGRRCFVSNLAWRTSWQDLKDKFRECGTVVYTNVMRDESGRSKGWGIVEFETSEEAVQAMNTMNGAEIHGRPIIVREDREDREIKDFGDRAGKPGRGRGGKREGEPAPPGTQVVVHGLPWSYTGAQLHEIFQGIGDIVSGDIAYGRDGRSRGYGVIQFATPEQAAEAIQQFNGTELEGRTLSVKIDSFA
jgi:RNA recognition motif-containing protein